MISTTGKSPSTALVIMKKRYWQIRKIYLDARKNYTQLHLTHRPYSVHDVCCTGPGTTSDPGLSYRLCGPTQ